MLLAPLVLLGACNGQDEADVAPMPVRPVRTITVTAAPLQSVPSFSGQIEARDQATLAFRIGGRVAERLVAVGDTVREGQALARLDPETELNELRSARAALAAAHGVLRQAEGRHERQSHLYGRRVTSRADLEDAEQALKTARSQVEAAEAQVRIAEDVVGFTVLKADAPGVVTAVGAEPGEVVAAGRMVVRLARRDGRDAVFDIPAAALPAMEVGHRVTVELAGSSAASANGRVREVAPEADPVTRLFRIRVGVSEPPASFRLGVSVQGTPAPVEANGVSIPAAALVRAGDEAAVLVVDPATLTLQRRAIELADENPAVAVVRRGLADGDVVVTAGVSGLKPGQKVRLAGVEP
jgi:RND family efflux transporter MFP subunit